MDINDIALNINAAKGLRFIELGRWLNKKPNKTELEEKAAKSFLIIYRGTLAITLIFVVILIGLTSYAMATPSMGYQGSYHSSRGGRVENGQIRYIKNTLFYVSQEEAGLPPNEFPEGTNVSIYFDEDDNIVAVANRDETTKETEHRIILCFVVMGLMLFSLIVFATVGNKTFGKPWAQWIEHIRNSEN